jgi:hypothetical protein
MNRRGKLRWLSPALAIGLSTGNAAQAEVSASAPAKAAQNPVAAMISMPLQNNTSCNVGPHDKTQHTQNIQPVIPADFNAKWNPVTRTTVAVISQPAFVPGQGVNGN